jgi:hypothetical protein
MEKTVENKKTVCLGTRITPRIKELFEKVCAAKGMNEAEYLRQLIINELAQLSVLTTELEKVKEEIRSERRNETP